jgi:CRP/FNR family transcriptional regulator, cyclic AMP receptor protein
MSPKTARPFNSGVFLASRASGSRRTDYGEGATIFSQGDASSSVLYVVRGSVKLSVVSNSGREVVVAILGTGDFVGEGALAGQPVRLATATALTSCRLLLIPKRQMIQLLHEHHAFSASFITHMLSRNARLQEDLVDQLFNASEKRLARTLLLLAQYGKQNGPRRLLPKISQEVLAEMVGTTRSRVNLFMNKFRRLGFIEYNGAIKVHDSLLSVILNTPAPARRR